MSTNPNNISIPSREQFGLPPMDNDRRDSDVPTVAVATPGVIPTPQLDWILSTISKLESRLAATECQPVDHRMPPRPGTDPPYALPIPATVRTSHIQQHPFQTAVPEGQFQPQPYVMPPAHNNNFHVHAATACNRQTQLSSYPSQPFHQGFQPPFYGSHNLGQSRPYLSHAPTGPQILPPPIGFGSQFDRPFYTNLPGPRPMSCWYPSADQHRSVRMDPPRFDGSDAANGIFKIQYYFDHMMMPDAGSHLPSACTHDHDNSRETSIKTSNDPEVENIGSSNKGISPLISLKASPDGEESILGRDDQYEAKKLDEQDGIPKCSQDISDELHTNSEVAIQGNVSIGYNNSRELEQLVSSDELDNKSKEAKGMETTTQTNNTDAAAG